MKKILFGLFILGTLILSAQEAATSGTPRIMRKSNLGTEVFFTNLNQSYFIPFDEQHNAKFEVINKAMVNKVPVGFRADPVSRRILSVTGQKTKETSADVPDEPSEQPKKSEGTKSQSAPGSPGLAPNK